jgi:phage recombination protein Bet
VSAQPQEVTVITKGEVAQAQQQRVSLLETFAHKYGLDPKNMMRTLKATAFKGDVSDDQMAALLIVAKAHNLNPWTKEIYAFPSQQGIVPIVGVDGWARIINEHQQFDGMEFALSGETGKEAYTCTIHRKDREHPVTVTEYMTECYRPTAPWKSHPLRMLRHKAMIQCARLAFSFAGIYDPDEGERVLAAENAIDVTPVEEREQTTNFGPVKISAVKMRTICEGAIAAAGKGDAQALWEVWGPLSNAEIELVWKQLRSYERSAIKKLQTTNEYKIAESGLDIPAWSISVLQAAKDLAAVDKAYATIEEIYTEHDQEVPLDIQTIRHDRRAELGAVQ